MRNAHCERVAVQSALCPYFLFYICWCCVCVSSLVVCIARARACCAAAGDVFVHRALAGWHVQLRAARKTDVNIMCCILVYVHKYACVFARACTRLARLLVAAAVHV